MPRGDFSFPCTINEIQRDIYGVARDGDVILDCGANVGISARRFLKQRAARVICFDPLPQHICCLFRNLQGYRPPQVYVSSFGVWREELLGVTLSRDNHFDSSDSVVVCKGSRSVAVNLTTIDRMVKELDVTPTFIKMDIEGAEIPALIGAGATISRLLPRLAVAAEHFITDVRSIPDTINSIAPDKYTFQITPDKIIYANPVTSVPA